MPPSVEEKEDGDPELGEIKRVDSSSTQIELNEAHMNRMTPEEAALLKAVAEKGGQAL